MEDLDLGMGPRRQRLARVIPRIQLLRGAEIYKSQPDTTRLRGYNSSLSATATAHFHTFDLGRHYQETPCAGLQRLSGLDVPTTPLRPKSIDAANSSTAAAKPTPRATYPTRTCFEKACVPTVKKERRQSKLQR